jgi:alpha-1,3-glucan synthase
MVIIKGFWMSSTYSRNWKFLWASVQAPPWAIGLLILLFYVVLWSIAVLALARLSKRHSWLIPIFAISLGAPDWCQMLWGVSGMGNSIPWAGFVEGALLSRSAWLWMGLLASLQNLGYGMMLMMTMTRLHITFVLVMSQMIGSCVTVFAQLGAPQSKVVSNVYANVAADPSATPWFWLSLGFKYASASHTSL